MQLPRIRSHVNCGNIAHQFLLRRPTHLARRVSVRLGVLQTDRNLARRQIPASVAVIFLARPRDVDGEGFRVLLDLRRGLGRDGQRHRTQQRQKERERRKQASHHEPPGGRIYVFRVYANRFGLGTYRLVLQGDGRKPWLNLRCRLRADSRPTTWRHGMNPRA
jgi:hypothetical protein